MTLHRSPTFRPILFIVLVLFSLSSCRVGKHFREQGGHLLVSSKIDIDSEDKIEDKFLLKTELSSLQKQVPNGNLLGIPKEWIYLKHSDPDDSTWFNNWAREKVGQPPVVLDSSKMIETAASMQKFLRNKKGFYNASVVPEVDYDGHKAKLTYSITTNSRYYIDSIFYIGEDTSLINIIEGMRSESLVIQGDPADAALFDLEKNRIVVALQNMGYADFVGNYIDIKGDSSNNDFTIDIFMEIISPPNAKNHEKYSVGQINVFTDYYKGQSVFNTDSALYNNRTYRHELSKFLVKPSTIDKSIFLNEGELLTRKNRTKTFRRLSDLNTYRFVALNPILREGESNIIDYDIYLTPHQKKWILDTGSDVYYSNFTQRDRQLIGFGVNGSMTNRNFLRGAERFKISGEVGLEFNPVDFNINRYNYSLNNALQIPKVIDYAGILKALNLSRLMSDRRYDKFVREAKTNFSLGYSNIGVVDFYGVSSFDVSAQYEYRVSNQSQVNIVPSAFSLNTYILGVNFDTIVGNNQLIRNSFADNLLTGYLFNKVTYLYNSSVSPRGFSNSFIVDLEVSGWETYLANGLYNIVSGTNRTWKFLDQFEFSQFAKLEVDYRLYKDIVKGHTLASRVNAGLAVPFGNSDAVPFIKQFSVGGPNSMRAWNQNELGPGSYLDPIPNPSQLFFQQGDIKLEFNIEYRADLFWIIDGALFTDVGNIWTLKEDSRTGGKFTRDFYNDLAVAAGWGIRFDFVYFNIRFDFGYRLRNPYPDEEGNYWNDNIFSPSRIGNLQVAVNNPF